MKYLNLEIACTAIGVLVLSAGCAGHTLSTTDSDQSLKTERVEDSLAHVPIGPSSKTVDPSRSASRHSSTSSGTLAFQPDASPSMFLFDIPFRFDRFTLLSDARAMVEVNAMRLKEHDNNTPALLLEGRCDEIGSRDYNLVLGERRAQAVKEYLVDLGIPSASITITSFGKDRPLCEEHNESCRAKNRTVHFAVK